MTEPGQTPARRGRPRPADPQALDDLLDELEIDPPGPPEYHLVSEWAVKHVWRVEVDGEAWAYIRSLPGPASAYPERWRHLRLAADLFEAGVGPPVLGMTQDSRALGGHAAVIEAALAPIEREELESRAGEAIDLLARLHGCLPLHAALAEDLTEADRKGFSPLANLFAETRERWFEAVAARWQELGLEQIDLALHIVGGLLAHLESLDHAASRIGTIVPAHNDPNHGNFMLDDEGRLRLIDFEELALNNPVADLGIFLTWYVDKERQREMLAAHYPLLDPDGVLARMQVWVPLRYIGIAAHWAGRLTRAANRETWDFAADSIDEWLGGACELIGNGDDPGDVAGLVGELRDSLRDGPAGEGEL